MNIWISIHDKQWYCIFDRQMDLLKIEIHLFIRDLHVLVFESEKGCGCGADNADAFGCFYLVLTKHSCKRLSDELMSRWNVYLGAGYSARSTLWWLKYLGCSIGHMFTYWEINVRGRMTKCIFFLFHSTEFIFAMRNKCQRWTKKKKNGVGRKLDLVWCHIQQIN